MATEVNGIYNHLSKGDRHNELMRHLPPVTVHYVWCHNGHFEYKHYLSLLSIAKILQPDQIIFHFLEMPLSDRKGYLTWFEDIQREVPMLSLKQLKDHKHCDKFFKGVHKNEDFSYTGGIFIMGDIILANLSREVFYHLNNNLDMNVYNVCNTNSVVSCAQQNRISTQLFLVPEAEQYNLSAVDKRILLHCPSLMHVTKPSEHFCIHTSQHLVPYEIWHQNTSFHNFARQIVYNTQTVLVPFSETNIPMKKIVHILNLYGTSVDHLCLLSIKSAFIRGAVDHVFLHTHKFVKDPLWHELRQNYSVSYVHAPELDSSQHSKVLYGMHTLAQYGGMIMTCNIIFQKHSGFLFDYPAVATVQKSKNRLAHLLDFGIFFAKTDSLFLKMLIPVLKQLDDTSSPLDAGAIGYHVYEQYPSALYLETNLFEHQICNKDVCHSTLEETNTGNSFFTKLSWASDTKDISLHQLVSLKTPSKSVHQILGNVKL